MPPVITQTKAIWKVGEAPPGFTVSGHTGALSWTATKGGLLVPADEAETTLSAPNRSWYGPEKMAVTLADAGTGQSATAHVEIYARFPYQPDWRFTSEVDEEVEIFPAEDGNETYRLLTDPFATWQLEFNDRDPEEYREALLFRAHHRKDRHFYLEDLGLEETQLVRFDSAIRRSPLGPNGVSYSFQVRCVKWQPPDFGGLGDLPLYGAPQYGETV